MARVHLFIASFAVFWLGDLSPLMGRDVVRQILADGFDFPVGFPNAKGYYKYRGYTPNGHLGEDWNGIGGGNSDIGDPICSVAHGVVVFSDDVAGGWGNCIIVRHAYRGESGKIRLVDSQYGHLLKRYVKLHDRVRRGQKIGEMGSNRRMYWSHLHFEMRKELRLGMARSSWPRDNTCYYHPTNFINAHRKLRISSKLYPIEVNTFVGQGQLGADPRLKSLEVNVGENGLPPIGEKKSQEKSVALRDIFAKLRQEQAEKGESSLEKMLARLEDRQAARG